jgi:hypothetical protein
MTHGWAGKHVAVYRCQRSSAAGRCPRPVLVTASAVDEYVERAYVYVLEQTGALSTKASPVEAQTSQTDTLTAELEEAEHELAEYRDANLISVIGKDAYMGGLSERAARVDAARRALVEAQATAPWEREVDPATAWSALSLQDKRILLDGLVESIIVTPTTRGDRRHVRHRLRWVWKRPEVTIRGVELVTEHEVGQA